MPEVGEDETAWEDVDKFYDFWFSFKSWREFPHPDEEDVEQAECREEKRCATCCMAVLLDIAGCGAWTPL